MTPSREAICVLMLSVSAGVNAGDSGLTSVFVATVEKPVFLTHAPGDFDRLFVVGQDGVIFIIKDDLVLEDPFLDLTALVDTRSHLRGLLGLAFHPQYQINGLLYVCYTALPDGDVVLARYEVTADPDIADPETAHNLLSMPHPGLGHHGNWVGFSPINGLLYFAVGDGAAPYDRDDDAQNLDSLLGKVLRLDVDGDDFPEDPERNYAIPPDNPFVGVNGADEVWIFGFRNPWRCSFDRLSGDLYIGDAGEDAREELNFQPAQSAGGENYGWDCKEGTQCTDEDTCDCTDPSLIDPLLEYDHFGGQRAVIAGYVYRGCAIDQLGGAFILADFSAEQIWQLRHDGRQVTELIEIQDDLDPGGDHTLDGPIASFGEDALGELFFCERNSGEIFKIVAAAGVGPDCNDNGVSDACDIASGDSDDINGDGVPDECQIIGDIDGDGAVGTPDLLLLLGAWGICNDCDKCPADLDANCSVDGADLIILLGNWG